MNTATLLIILSNIWFAVYALSADQSVAIFSLRLALLLSVGALVSSLTLDRKHSK